jgi:PAS domain S-box-containing protein
MGRPVSTLSQPGPAGPARTPAPGATPTAGSVSPRIVGGLRRFSEGAGWAVGATGAMVVIGWFADIDILRRGLPSLSTMKFHTAVCFLALGAGLVVLQRLPRRPGIVGLVAGMSAAAPVITLIEYATDTRLGIDNPFGLDQAASGPTTVPGRMAPATALCFVLAALALATHAYDRRRVPIACALVALVLATLALMGYAYGVESLYHFSFTSVALHTATGFVLAGLGLLVARPEESPASLVASTTAGGTTLRRLLPTAVVLPLVTGSLAAFLVRRADVDPPLAFAAFTLTMVLSLGTMTWANAARLHHTDVQRVDAERMAVRLASSEERTRRILDTASDAYIVMSTDGRVTAWNRQAEISFGWTAAEAIGRPVHELIIPERHRRAHREGLARFLATGNAPVVDARLELEANDRDGRELPIELTVWIIENEGVPEFNAFVHDVSVRRAAAAELDQRRRELERSNEDLEQFAYVASHDLREPLRAMASFSQLLEHDYGDVLDDTGREYLAFVQDGAARMRRIIDDILTYSRAGHTAGTEALALGTLVDDLLVGLGPTIDDAHAHITVSELPEVHGSRTQLELLIQNLLSNAIKFSRPDREPEIALTAQRGADDGWELRVDDNGIGIAPEHRERIFKMFKRLHTRDEYSGTGIGLAVCRKIARANGGDITHADSPLGGSRFVVTLPAAPQPALPPRRLSAAGPVPASPA